jgi:hypothetical protein
MVALLAPTSAERKIPYHAHKSEFEVQAELYQALKNIGRDVRGEVKTTYQAKGKGERAALCRFDLVVYEDKTAVHIFEVKRHATRHKNGVEATRQSQRYRTYGLPVTYVYGLDDIPAALSAVSRGAHAPQAQSTSASATPESA